MKEKIMNILYEYSVTAPEGYDWLNDIDYDKVVDDIVCVFEQEISRVLREEEGQITRRAFKAYLNESKPEEGFMEWLDRMEKYR